jgi:POT family proton-dependent oligopeptide transporter
MPTQPAVQSDNKKQPKGLYLLFFTELWERFGFYTLQTIIILYMTKGLFLPDTQANLLYAAFSALLYLTPTIGGYLADRYLGFQRSITIGGVLFVIAYILCAFQSRTIFFIGLGTLICANGLFKPSVSSIVGELYQKDDPRREGGFTLFYMGINVGALIPPLIAGTLVAHYGWHAGFILAAVGMMIGQLIFSFGKRYLRDAGLQPQCNRTLKSPNKLFYGLLFLGIIAVIGLCQLAFHYPEIANSVVIIASVATLLIVGFFMLKEPLEQRNRMIASLVLILISVIFWAIYNQTFTSLMLFADRNMDKQILGIPLNAEATQFFNPFFIIALSPILSRLWIRMDRQSLNPSIQMKFSLGVLFMCFGLAVLAIGAQFFGDNGMTSPWWLVSSYCMQTIGELLISPIGLAMITVLCPRHLVGMMMGVWFFAQAASSAIAGILANVAAVPENLSAVASLPIYSHAFTIYSLISFGMAIVSFALIPFLNRMIDKKTNN